MLEIDNGDKAVQSNRVEKGLTESIEILYTHAINGGENRRKVWTEWRLRCKENGVRESSIRSCSALHRNCLYKPDHLSPTSAEHTLRKDHLSFSK